MNSFKTFSFKKSIKLAKGGFHSISKWHVCILLSIYVHMSYMCVLNTRHNTGWILTIVCLDFVNIVCIFYILFL